MKLSDAIRVGSKLRAPSEIGWSDVGPDGKIRSCALLAAAEGAGLFTIVGGSVTPGPNWLKPADTDAVDRLGVPVSASTVKSRIPDEWGVVNDREIPPCACRRFGVPDQVLILIWHLHDIHGWSREAVAEWIETLELKVSREAARREAMRQEILRSEEIVE